MNAILHVSISRALHDSWAHSGQEAHLAIGGIGVAAWGAGINWAAVAAFLSVAAPVAGGIVISLWKQYRIACLEIADRERKLAAAPLIILPSAPPADPAAP